MRTNLKEPSRRTIIDLLECQRRVLERIATGAPLTEILLTLVTLVERLAPEMRCAILRPDSSGRRLEFVAAPSLPDDFKACMAPFLGIGPDMANCGRAAFHREPVYTEDVALDPRWTQCRDVALRNGIRAAWSTPILSDDNVVLGTFAMFYGKPGLPDRDHVQLIDMSVQMARVAIDAKEREESLQQAEDTLRRNQAFFAGEAQRIGRLLGTTASGDPLASSGAVAATSSVEATTTVSGAAGGESSASADRRLAAERRALQSLTPNERAIMRLITEGKSNAEVADELRLSPRTVETYRARLMQKLLVEDVVGLVKFAIRHGITSVG